MLDDSDGKTLDDCDVVPKIVVASAVDTIVVVEACTVVESMGPVEGFNVDCNVDSTEAASVLVVDNAVDAKDVE